ncbi:hypothetical protein ACJMK2_020561 [Sinanodonta woodiana]|uniref:Uncharacterized protein n=1 Tax=Sinanodonta woodiana TaxID=1069815 RepID=A0ABD3TZM7_SINWO
MQVITLHRLCLKEGIDEWKVDQTLKTGECTPITPNKKKFKFRFNDRYSIFDRGGRSQRCSLPSLDIQGVNNLNCTIGKQRSYLPTVALTTLNKQHFSKGGRRASLASVECFKLRMSNGERRKKQSTNPADLHIMPEDHLLKMHVSSSSIDSLASNDSGVSTVVTNIAVSDVRRTSNPAEVDADSKGNTSDTY